MKIRITIIKLKKKCIRNVCGPTNWIWRWGPILCIRDHAILFAARSFQTTKKKNVFFFCYLSLSRAQFRFRFRFILITLSMLFWTNEVFFTHLVFSALFRIPWRSLLTPVFPLAICSVQFLWAIIFGFVLFSNLRYLHVTVDSIHSLHARSCSENCSHNFILGIKLIVRKWIKWSENMEIEV